LIAESVSLKITVFKDTNVIEIFAQTLTAISLAISAFAGGIAVLKYRDDLREAQRLRWQKATVQKIFQQHEKIMTFEKIRTHYRSEAAEMMGGVLGKTDIEEESLRQILVDLCGDSVIVQMGNDNYSVSTYLSSMEKMQGTTNEMLQLQKVFFEAQLEILGEQNGKVAQMIEHQKTLFTKLK
jgi:hypothetical protein